MEEGRAHKRVLVYDCRSKNGGNAAGNWLDISGLDFNNFLRLLHRTFPIQPHEKFVLATLDKAVLDFDKFGELQDSSTLYLRQQDDPTLMPITFDPHFHTLVKSGLYEYYGSQGQNPLPYAIAELIDNSILATAKNTGVRTIEIRMLFDETLGKPAMIVLDNGCGMTPKQLNDWAVYRRSKFEREVYVRPEPVPRSLNSDISYFGVGGKQAVFYIADSTRMITKPEGPACVHELILSTEDFERKERNKEDIYTGTILSRKPGNSSHVNKDDERFLHSLIAEESGKESFTAVVLTGILPEHIKFLKDEFEVWTIQLADIYHYYIHGVHGNGPSSSSTSTDHLPLVNIQITLLEKPPRCPRMMNLREVDTDMQTLYINAATDTFEFKASTEKNGGTVEGVIRYHPFLYDKETYPEDPNALHAPLDDDDYDNESGKLQPGRGKRPIFNCFWNGRLIPHTTVDEFEWCSQSKGAKELAECYNRISGVLFTDDGFKVTTNKLTFVALEMKLMNKNTIFTRMSNGQRQRGNIQKEFTQWLKNCHEKRDKQIKFLGYQETITRENVPKKMLYPWATFSSIEWDGKIYQKGQLVKSHKTHPIMYGSVVRFMLYGKHDGNVFATGGQVELALEPKAFHDKIKIIPISKIDRNASDEAIKKNIDDDAAKLPDSLHLTWPHGNNWPQNAVLPAGTVFGPLKVQILDTKGAFLSRMPGGGQGAGKRLSMVLKIVMHGDKGDQTVSRFAAPHSLAWGFWFKEIETLTKLGKYTMTLTATITETNATSFGGRELPSYKLDFTITEGRAESFVIAAEIPTIHVGIPFNIPLLMKDAYNHSTTPPPDLKPVLKCSDLDLSYETVHSSGTTLTIKGVKARGKQQSKTYNLKVILPGLKENSQTMKISLLSGYPHSLHVKPEDCPITVENGNPITFNVEVHDEAGNITTRSKQIVRCQIQGFPLITTDCSTTGAGQLLTKPIDMKIINGEPQDIKVQFDMPNQKKLALVVRDLQVVPSTRVTRMKICSEDDENLVLRNDEKIEWLAGGMLENLFYKLYDEAEREVLPTAEIASRIKVNWTRHVNVEDLVQGKLPDLQVPTQVKESRFYQVSYQDQSVSVSFHIIPRPDEPTLLKATLLQNTVKLGEILPGNINLELVDQYDNATKTLTPTCKDHMTVEAEGLDKSAVTLRWQESSSSVLVSGVQFQSGPPGRREICFTYKSYVERVIIKVTAGVPAQLKLVSGPEQPLQVLNDQAIATPFLVQLCDTWGNPSTDQRVVVELKSSPQTLKVMTAVISQPVNAEGKASFTVNSLSGPKGYYQLVFKGYLNQKPIPGPSVTLTVIPDPNKPVSLSVEYNTSARFPAGGVFPVFSVTVVSDEGSPITNFNPAAMSMLLWEGVPSGKKPPQMATELKCSKPMKNEKNDRFHFRDKVIPEHVGKYTVQFSLRIDKTKVLFSNQIPINVVANQPVKLGPDSQPPTPVVSFSKDIASRTLVENMTLRITDLYGNPTAQELVGTVAVSIKNCSGDGNKSLPLFEGNTNGLKMSLTEGKTHITRLAIMENSPGENGSTYVLLFNPEGLMIPAALAPFELPFRFCNDVENQRKMSELSKRKDKCIKAISAYTEHFDTNNDLLQLLTSHHVIARNKEAEVRNELMKRNVTVAQTVPDIDRLLTEKKNEVERIMRTPRRVCSIPDHFRGQQDVLGTVGHLAFVQDDAAARVISWHVKGDMDCVITRTTAAARRIYDDTRGEKQVMALDSVYVHPGDRPLPHILRNGRMLFDPPGNPVLARDLLLYQNDPESCKIVFKNILGDTILIDDLDSANNYRRAVVQNKIPCATILTRQGDRISAKGKFGGAQNKAPPINQLKVFGAPLPQHYHTLSEHIELLFEHQAALDKKNRTEKERDDHLNTMRSRKMLIEKREMEEKKKELEEIERQLELTPVRLMKRGIVDAGEPSGINNTKRAKRLPSAT